MKRTLCHVCGADVAIKKDGMLVKHGQHHADHNPAGERTGDICEGSGKPWKK